MLLVSNVILMIHDSSTISPEYMITEVNDFISILLYIHAV